MLKALEVSRSLSSAYLYAHDDEAELFIDLKYKKFKVMVNSVVISSSVCPCVHTILFLFRFKTLDIQKYKTVGHNT